MKKKALIIWFIVVLTICFTSIIASTIMIDNLIDSYIEEIKTVVNVDVINNTNDEVVVENKNGNFKIYINNNEEEVITEASEFKSFYIRVVTDKGLNIRKEPDLSSVVVGTINYGDTVLVIDEIDGWYKTDKGYIKIDFTVKI